MLWLITILLIIVFTGGVLFLMPRDRHKMLVICGCLIAISVGGGFVIYSYSYLATGAGLADTLSAALRGIFSTARMFIINEDYGSFVVLTENVWLQILFWFFHVMALFAIQAALISLFGWKIIDYFRLRFGWHREVFMIKGSDSKALLLGENIATHDKMRNGRPDRNRLIVFLLDEDEDAKKTYEKVFCFGGIIQVLNRKKDLSYYLNKAGLGKRKLKKKEFHIILFPNNKSSLDDVQHIVEYAKGKKVNPEHLDIFVFTETEWDRESIEAISQAKENDIRKYPYTIHIINEIDLLLRQMIEIHHPVTCVGLNFDKEGVTARDFTVMVIGFGTVGQQAFLRLIMNGQFVGSNMQAIVIDKEIVHKQKHFVHCYPLLDPDLNSSLNICEIKFMGIDARDKEFFDLLDGITDVDYIIVASSDDELNKDTALDIRLYYERRKVKNLPFIAVFEKNGGLYLKKHDEAKTRFGCREAIYKHSLVINDEVNRMAKAFHEVYGGTPPWYELDWFTQESNRAAADFIPAMLKLARIKEEDAENMPALVDDALAEILAQTEHLRWNAFHAVMGYQPMTMNKMHQQYESYLKKEFPISYCRKDPIAKLHICLVVWDELDEISKAYNEITGEKRDFKKYDRDIIENIPKFLKAASK